MHCPDRSDEASCFNVDVDESYLRDTPPAPPPGSADPMLAVDVGVDLLAITDIQEVESTITAQFRLHLTWRDASLRLRNLKKEAHNNEPRQIDRY